MKEHTFMLNEVDTDMLYNLILSDIIVSNSSNKRFLREIDYKEFEFKTQNINFSFNLNEHYINLLPSSFTTNLNSTKEIRLLGENIKEYVNTIERIEAYIYACKNKEKTVETKQYFHENGVFEECIIQKNKEV